MQVFAKPGESLQQVGGECPDGWVVMNGQRPDIKSVATEDGIWEYPTEETTNAERDRAKNVLNPLRDTFLNRLSGIAMFSEDASIKNECASLRLALLDITKDPAFLVATTYEEMENSLMYAYKYIAATASPSIKTVFRELNG